MADPRSMMIDSVIELLRSLKNSRTPIRFETHESGACVVTVGTLDLEKVKPAPAAADLERVTALNTPKRRGRPRGSKTTKARSSVDPLDGADELIMHYLDQEAHRTGENLSTITRDLGSSAEEKPAIKASLKQLVKSKKLVKIAGSRYRRSDVTVKRGPKRASRQDRPAPSPGGPAGEKNDKNASATQTMKGRGPGRPKGSGKGKKATPAQLAALAKAHAARRKKPAAKRKETPGKKAGAKKSKRTAKRTARAKATPTKRAVSLKKKAGKAAKKVSQKALPERTDGAGQIPREETRRLLADGNEATPPSE